MQADLFSLVAAPATASVPLRRPHRRSARVFTSCVFAAAMLLLSGCYEYRQLDWPRPLSGGTAVRVELTDAGATNVAPAIGPMATVVEGTVTNADTSGLTLSLEVVRRRGQGEARWHGETLTLGRADIREIDERRTSRSRTAIAVAAVGTVGVALVIAIARATGLVSGNPGRPPVPGT